TSVRRGVPAPAGEAASYFEAHKDTLKIPKKHKIGSLLIDVEALRAKGVIPPAEVERQYNANIDQYTTPEQVRASHILLKTDGTNDAAVKTKAEALLKQIKAGADFAELAKRNSEDEASAEKRGELHYFRPGAEGDGIRQ